jgi:hypothetical protein
MTPINNSKSSKALTILESQQGLILIAALTLLAALTLAGATAFIVASTDVKVGGNFRTSQTALQVAMAGAEQARQSLRALNSSSVVKTNFSEELLSRVGANLLLNGYTSATDDVPLASSSTLMSGYSFAAYLTNDPGEGAANVVDLDGKVVITSVATGPNNSKAVVQSTVRLFSFSATSPATVYSKDNVTLSGSAVVVSGVDASPTCSGGGLAPVYTTDPATTTQNGLPILLGSPSTPQTGNLDIDLESYADTLKAGAGVTLTNDVSNGTYGSPTNYVTVYADATAQADGELKLTNAVGYGTLVVKGDLELSGNLTWHGVIIVTGNIKSTGGGVSAKNILGQVYSGKSDLGDSTISGSITIGYHSCNVREALSSQPLKLVNWKQNY